MPGLGPKFCIGAPPGAPGAAPAAPGAVVVAASAVVAPSNAAAATRNARFMMVSLVMPNGPQRSPYQAVPPKVGRPEPSDPSENRDPSRGSARDPRPSARAL